MPHRLQVAGVVGGVTYVNDSKATNVDATLKALTAYSGGVHLILGGYDKGADYDELAAASEGRVQQALLIGATAPQLEAAFAARAAAAGPRATPFVVCGDLETAVMVAARGAAPGDVVLLSPACASWDQYRDYVERGEHFLRLVNELGNRSCHALMTTRRGVRNADLDHSDWVDDTAPRERRGGDRRAAERRGGERREQARRRSTGQAPAPERRAAERRGAAERRSGGRRDPDVRRRAAPALAPGVGERRGLVFITVLLLLYGLVMAYSASAAEAFFQHGSSFYLIQRQVVYAVLGLGVMWVLSRVDYAWYRKLAVPFSVLAFAGWPPCSCRASGRASTAPAAGSSSAASPCSPASSPSSPRSCSSRRSSPRARGRSTTPRGFARLVAIGIVPAAALIMLEPDLGTTLVLVGAVCAVLVAGGARLRDLLGLVLAGGLVVLALIIVEPYRLERLTTFLDPWKDPQGSGFQATQSLISIASGRIFGVGLGNSVQKFGYLPEQSTRHDHRHHRRGARPHRPRACCWCCTPPSPGRVSASPSTARSCSASCWPRASPRSSSGRPASTSARRWACCRSPVCRCRSCRWAAPACWWCSPAWASC